MNMDRKTSKIIGIVSYNCHSDHMNYGAVLHSYAFQQYLLTKDVHSVILDYLPMTIEGMNFKYPVLNYKRFWHIKDFFLYFISWGVLGFLPNLRKYKKFQKFFSEYYVKTKHTYKQCELLKMQSLEDYKISEWVVESDVVWKLYSTGGFDKVFFLQAPFMINKRKVAYSPTISSRPFDKEEKETFLEYVNDFYEISCRDREGAEYLSSIIGRKVEWVVDPTLLLDSNHYKKIEKEPVFKPNHYLLTYNCMSNDATMLDQAQKLADKLGLQMIEISNFNINKLKYKHRVLTDIGIEEFLWYFSHADFIICNAFHGCCFSVIYKKEFFLFQRDGSDYRMKSITHGLGLNNRFVPFTDKRIPDDFNLIDYNSVYDKLNALRNVSFDFIDRNIIS